MSDHMPLLLGTTMLLSMLLCPPPAQALDPRFELDIQQLRNKLPAAADKGPAPRKVRDASYVVKPGDNLMKILVRDYGMDDDAAAALIPKIRRVNRIGNIRHLKTGERLIIPLPTTGADQPPPKTRVAGKPRNRVPRLATTAGLSLMVTPPKVNFDGLETAKLTWQKLLPGQQWPNQTLSISGKNFSLYLDPTIYPLIPAADGGKILVETGEKLSPLVKSLIREHDPEIRFVSDNQGNRKRFIAGLLSAAGFYSVEEDFTVNFGTDPKLTVNADFKIEKSGDSSLQQDITLLNIDPRWTGMPDILADYLSRQGLNVVELNPATPQQSRSAANKIHIISDRTPSAIADRLLNSLGLAYDQDRDIPFTMGGSGISLRIRVERYFESKGEKFVINTFDGDPESYTLLRLLESMKYQIILLNQDEDFLSVSRKLFTRLRLPSNYTLQEMVAAREIPYRIQISGIRVDNPDGSGSQFFTSSQPGKLVGELLEMNGYSLISGQ